MLGIAFACFAVVTIGTALANRGGSRTNGLKRAYITFERDNKLQGGSALWVGKIHKHPPGAKGSPKGASAGVPIGDSGTVLDGRSSNSTGNGDLTHKGEPHSNGIGLGSSAKATASRIEHEMEWLQEENKVMLNLSLQLEQNKFDASEAKKIESQMKSVSEKEREKLKQLQELLTLQDKQIREFFSHPGHTNISTDGVPQGTDSAGASALPPSSRPTVATSRPTSSPSQSTAQPTSKPTLPPTVSFVPEALGLDDIAFAVIGDRNMLYTWQLIPPKLHIIKTSTKQPYNFLVALRMLKIEHPNTKWYVVVDDDVFFFVGNLLKQLENLDSRRPHLIGSHNCQGPSFTGQHKKRVRASGYKGWVHGGPGVVYSQGLAKRMDVDCCLAFYSNSNNWPWRGVDDVVATACAMDYWPNGFITNFPGFFPQPPGSRSNDHRCECRIRPPRCTYRRKEVLARPELQVSYHHVNSQHSMNLFVGEVERLEKQGFKDVLVNNKTALLRLNKNRRVMQQPKNVQCSQ